MKKDPAEQLQSSLYFTGFEGSIENIPQDTANVLYVLDANVVLQLIRLDKGGASAAIGNFLANSKPLVATSWNAPSPKLAIDPTMGIIELTRQHQRPNAKEFLSAFDALVCKLYDINDYSSRWALETYIAAMAASIGVLPSIVATIEKTYSLISREDKISDEVIVNTLHSLLSWLLQNHDRLTLIGGPLLYATSYAIAGSPDARHLLKVNDARKGNARIVAKNVAWDFLYWLRLDVEYQRSDLEDCIICTSDRALAGLLGSRINRGPRGKLTSGSPPQLVESYGTINPFKFRRLENTKLESQLESMVMNFLARLDKLEDNSFKFGFRGSGMGRSCIGNN